ncbi:uncharacterized protein LOC126997568 [Eriocheir sinensis]|uniref:uncharacterized protein LOC126997568 n=1 Tax=Eriocheir sinensis TaxID=95602 RepID=UPI0021C7EF62|nr:uncharacterized protein LOC126997568 [Eriocheir sinensis]
MNSQSFVNAGTMKAPVVIVGSFLVVVMVSAVANATPSWKDPDVPDYFDDFDVDDEGYRKKREAADEDVSEDDEDDDEDDEEDDYLVRKKRQFKAEVEGHRGSGGKGYRASLGYSKSFNNGRTSVDAGGYQSGGSFGRDRGGYVGIKHRW